MKYTDEELLERLKEHVIKCAQIAWAAGNKSNTRIYNEMLQLLGLHNKGEEMIRFPVYPGKLWVRYPVGSLKEIEVRVFEPGEVEKDFDSTLSWAEFEVKGFYDEIPEGASMTSTYLAMTSTYLAMMSRQTDLQNQIHELERQNKYLEEALKNAGHVTTARKDQVKNAERKADSMAHRVVGLEDRVRLLELQLQKAEAEKGFAERERDELEKKNENQ